MLVSQGGEVGGKWLWDDSAIHCKIIEINLVGERKGGEVATRKSKCKRENKKKLREWFW